MMNSRFHGITICLNQKGIVDFAWNHLRANGDSLNNVLRIIYAFPCRGER